MRLQFLGDALDHWKGSLFQRLCGEGLLKNLHVEPMITDSRIWTLEELCAYTVLLNIKDRNFILHSDTTFTGNRLDYFNSIQHQGDLFLDPDTGIATGNPNRRHITIQEIELLLNKNPNRVLVIYQHTRQGITMSQRVDEVIKSLLREINDISCTSYESALVAMIFVSKRKERIKSINRYLHGLLCHAVKNRVRIWE